jgi:hypothetical protein
MPVLTGKVVNGLIDISDAHVPDGTEVSIYIRGEEPEVMLTPEQEAELEESFAEIERGLYVDGDEFLRKLRSR